MSLDFSNFLTIYKNKLLETVKISEVPLSNIDTFEEADTFKISIIGTPLHFIARQHTDNYQKITLGELDCKKTMIKPNFPLTDWYQYTSHYSVPGEPQRIHEKRLFSIAEVCKQLQSWLNDEVKQYYMLIDVISTPNLWNEIKNVQQFDMSHSFTKEDFEMFTVNEKKQIQDALSQFHKSLYEEIHPVKEDLREIQTKLDYLLKAVDRLNRFDWKGVALSTVIGIATNMSVDSSTGHRIIELFKQAFMSIKLLPK